MHARCDRDLQDTRRKVKMNFHAFVCITSPHRQCHSVTEKMKADASKAFRPFPRPEFLAQHRAQAKIHVRTYEKSALLTRHETAGCVRLLDARCW